MLNGGIKGPLQSFSLTSVPVKISLVQQQLLQGANLYPAPAKYQNYVTPGTYTFIVPDGVSTISAMAVGGGGTGDDGNSGDGGGGGGSGGSAGFFSDVTVTAGQSVTVVVGAGGVATAVKGTKAPDGSPSSVTVGTFVMSAPGGIGGTPYGASPGAYPPAGPSFTNTPVGATTGGYAGGGGGRAYNGGGGGGGAGGLGAVGGNGSAAIASGDYTTNFNGTSGGGGGGGANYGAGTSSANNGFSGGAGGAGQFDTTGGGGGGAATYSAANPPTAGAAGNGSTSNGSKGGNGGFPGGGGGGSWDSNTGLASTGGNGFVRIVWGTNGSGTRKFPTNAGDT